MKTVAYLKSAPIFPIQGADISMFERMLLLAEEGWTGLLLCTGLRGHGESFQKILENVGIQYRYDVKREELRYTHLGIECRLRLGERADRFAARDAGDIEPLFAALLQESASDFLFANLRDRVAAEYVAEKELPSLLFLTEDEYPRPGTEGANTFGELVRRAQGRIAVASNYMKESLERAYGESPLLFSNSIAVARYRLQKDAPGEFLTLLSPYRHKGLELVLALAETLPDRRFLVMSGTGAEYREMKPAITAHSNVELARFNLNAREVYRRSRIVLAPSIWQDACPRVVMEALASGTPVIGSGRGGMRDLGGDAVLYQPVEELPEGGYRLDGWISRIRELDDPGLYQKACAKAKAQAGEFENEVRRSMAELSALMSSSETQRSRPE